MAKPGITVHLKVAGFVDRKMVTAEFDLAAPERVTLKKLLALADQAEQLPGKPIKKMLGFPRPPTVLLNGEGVELPDGLGLELKNGDQVSIMTPFAGG